MKNQFFFVIVCSLISSFVYYIVFPIIFDSLGFNFGLNMYIISIIVYILFLVVRSYRYHQKISTKKNSLIVYLLSFLISGLFLPLIVYMLVGLQHPLENIIGNVISNNSIILMLSNLLYHIPFWILFICIIQLLLYFSTKIKHHNASSKILASITIMLGVMGFGLYQISSIQRGQYLRLSSPGYTRHIISFLQVDHVKINRNDITTYSGASDSYQLGSSLEPSTKSPKKATLSFEKCSHNINGIGVFCDYQKISTQEHPLSCVQSHHISYTGQIEPECFNITYDNNTSFLITRIER